MATRKGLTVSEWQGVVSDLKAGKTYDSIRSKRVFEGVEAAFWERNKADFHKQAGVKVEKKVE